MFGIAMFFAIQHAIETLGLVAGMVLDATHTKEKELMSFCPR